MASGCGRAGGQAASEALKVSLADIAAEPRTRGGGGGGGGGGAAAAAEAEGRPGPALARALARGLAEGPLRPAALPGSQGRARRGAEEDGAAGRAFAE